MLRDFCANFGAFIHSLKIKKKMTLSHPTITEAKATFKTCDIDNMFAESGKVNYQGKTKIISDHSQYSKGSGRVQLDSTVAIVQAHSSRELSADK